MNSSKPTFMFDSLLSWLHSHGDTPWVNALPDLLEQRFSQTNHGDFNNWLAALQALPDIKSEQHNFSRATVSIAAQPALSEVTRTQLKTDLLKFHPWRKGPFDLFDVFIDTEWQSNIKWDRIKHHLGSLKGQAILDIGCGNGYYLWRMMQDMPDMVIGIDTTLLFIMQFYAIKKYLAKQPAYALPINMDELPREMKIFDRVFMMGVLYHRKVPLDDLRQIRHWLKADGQLVLETLVIPGDNIATLVPEHRYAQMRNVWSIPTVPALVDWLEQSGYADITVLDVSITTTEEQRSTEWMHFQSLADFLDPNDASKTIEGHPAPMRAVITARSA